jgi:hypothetical protein
MEKVRLRIPALCLQPERSARPKDTSSVKRGESKCRCSTSIASAPRTANDLMSLSQQTTGQIVSRLGGGVVDAYLKHRRQGVYLRRQRWPELLRDRKTFMLFRVP